MAVEPRNKRRGTVETRPGHGSTRHTGTRVGIGFGTGSGNLDGGDTVILDVSVSFYSQPWQS